MQPTIAVNIKAISIIHIALAISQATFALVAYSIVQSNFVFFGGFEDPFIFVVPIVFILSIAVGKMMYQKLLIPSFEKESIADKLAVLLIATIVKLALSEFATIIAIVAYLFSNNFLYIIFAALMLAYFISLKPKKENIESDLKIDYKMKAEFDSMMN